MSSTQRALQHSIMQHGIIVGLRLAVIPLPRRDRTKVRSYHGLSFSVMSTVAPALGWLCPESFLQSAEKAGRAQGRPEPVPLLLDGHTILASARPRYPPPFCFLSFGFCASHRGRRLDDRRRRLLSRGAARGQPASSPHRGFRPRSHFVAEIEMR